MVTEKQYRWIVDHVYTVGHNKHDGQYTKIKEKTYYFDRRNKNLGQFQVLKVKDSTSNGMQAMAVAPVDKNGKADYSEVVIAYAGTNRADFKDLGTDIQSIGLGSDELKFFNLTADSQFSTALDFAKQVEKEVKTKNPNVVTIIGTMLSKPFVLDYKIINKQYCFIG
ncbi:hypothetical protein [Streptococcus pluranimalium]|uniref:Uncharacterized protein n=1 Tax=Streptococcus pluranimalium TaxID=82348 RepID=A0A2L0D2L5_9STRE|nr:hypothetical protein [Streptococcus pluranimalium]AUW96073.1 hypothetical protein C0J00_02505 [Streptococcus pluranimalium]